MERLNRIAFRDFNEQSDALNLITCQIFMDAHHFAGHLYHYATLLILHTVWTLAFVLLL